MVRSVSWIEAEEVASLLGDGPRSRPPGRSGDGDELARAEEEARAATASRLSAARVSGASSRAPGVSSRVPSPAPSSRAASAPAARGPGAPRSAELTANDLRAPPLDAAPRTRPFLDPRADLAERLRALAEHARDTYGPTALWIVDRDGLPLLAHGPGLFPAVAAALRATLSALARHVGSTQAAQLELEAGTFCTMRWAATRRGELALVMIGSRPIDLDESRELGALLIEAAA